MHLCLTFSLVYSERVEKLILNKIKLVNCSYAKRFLVIFNGLVFLGIRSAEDGQICKQLHWLKMRSGRTMAFGTTVHIPTSPDQ